MRYRPPKTTLLESKNSHQKIEDLKSVVADALGKIHGNLYGQAGMDIGRANFLRTAIIEVEKKIFNPDYFDRLSEKNQIKLYQTMAKNLEMALSFMTNLSEASTKILEVSASIQPEQKTIEVLTDEQKLNKKQKRAGILQLLQQTVEREEQKKLTLDNNEGDNNE